MQFSGINAKGFGDYIDGFAPVEGATGDGANLPGCPVADDFTRPLGDPAEGRLAAALSYRDSSTCPVPAPTPAIGSSADTHDQAAAAHIPHTLETREGTVQKPPWLTNRILGE